MPIVRFQIDTAMCLFGRTLVDDVQEYVTHMAEGKKLGDYHAHGGKNMSDSYLHKELTKKHPMTSDLYKEASGYVHFSTQHFHRVLDLERYKEKQEVAFKDLVSMTTGWGEKELRGALVAFLWATDAILSECKVWLAKRQATKPSAFPKWQRLAGAGNHADGSRSCEAKFMKRTPDDAMNVLWTAGQQFAPIGDVPVSLQGTRLGESEDKLLAIQAEVGEQLVKYAHDANGSVNDLVTRLRGDRGVIDALARVVPGVSPDAAASVALRVCAGCIDGSKVLRKDEKTRSAAGVETTRIVSDAERQSDMQTVDSNCSLDPVYKVAVAIGPLDKKIRNKQEPTFDGIDQALLDKHYHEYFRRFSPKTSGK